MHSKNQLFKLQDFNNQILFNHLVDFNSFNFKMKFKVLSLFCFFFNEEPNSMPLSIIKHKS